MTWTAPSDKTTGDVVTAAIWNASLGATGNMSETAPAKVTTAGDIVYATGANALTRLGIGSAGQVLTVSGGVPAWAAAPGATYKYKTATQTFTTTTTYADVTASTGSFAFSIAASEVWVVEYLLPLSFGGTGGVKFQITGPASPTGVNINGWDNRLTNVSSTDNLSASLLKPFTTATAFSADIISVASVATAISADAGKFTTGTQSMVYIVARIINGSNAGTVTLQAAQSVSNSTTTIGIGAYMSAAKMA